MFSPILYIWLVRVGFIYFLRKLIALMVVASLSGEPRILIGGKLFRRGEGVIDWVSF